MCHFLSLNHFVHTAPFHHLKIMQHNGVWTTKTSLSAGHHRPSWMVVTVRSLVLHDVVACDDDRVRPASDPSSLLLTLSEKCGGRFGSGSDDEPPPSQPAASSP